jgi:hypothetical protein
VTPPHPTIDRFSAATTKDRPIPQVEGPLIRQPEPAARLARILNNAATELWEACTLDDPAQMWEEARAIASRILAASPIA